MTFANPAGNASAAAARYVAALLELLGDRDPIAEQKTLVADVRTAVMGLKPEQLAEPEADGKWSVLDVVRHLAHTEIVYAYRYRVTVAHDKPNIPGFDQDHWSDRLATDGQTIESLLTRLETLRSWNLEFLHRLPDAVFEREGRHEERGWESLRHQVRLGAAHDVVHKRQIRRIVTAVS